MTERRRHTGHPDGAPWVAKRNKRDTTMFGWWRLGMDMSMLAVEAQGVVVQRLTMLARGGPAAQVEAQRMVTEKVLAAGEAMMLVASGASHRTVIHHYRRTVRANATRLSRGK
jgi:hypothetical protein